MPKIVVFSPAAQRDLATIADWLMQVGSGFRAHRKLEDRQDGIGTLPDDYALDAWDRVKSDCRLPIFHSYIVRYRWRADGSIYVVSVFGPGQNRSQ